MKKQLLTIFLCITIPFFIFSNLPTESIGDKNNDFTSFAGTMDLTPIAVCMGDVINAPHNNDHTLDPGDVLQFVLHDNVGTALGNIFSIKNPSDLSFSFIAGMIPNATYYISAIAGGDDGLGNVDLSDPDLSVAMGTPVQFLGSETLLQMVACQGDIVVIGGQSFNTTGDYQIVLIDAQGCDSIISLDLEVLNPIAAIMPMSTVLSCLNSSVTISAVPFTGNVNGTITYAWSGPGVITSNGLPTTTVDLAGTYTLTVSQILNGLVCSSSIATIEVLADLDLPIADAGPNTVIQCSAGGVPLNGTASSTGPCITYSWEGPNGFTSTDLLPFVTDPGTYTLTVFNNCNFCISQSSVFVTTNIQQLDVGPDIFIDCNNTPVTLNPITFSTGAGVTYQWTTPNGNIVSGGDTPNPVVDASGIYELSVDDGMGCVLSDELEVIAFENIANAGPDDLLGCVPEEITINASPNFNTTGLEFQWQDSQGAIVSSSAEIVINLSDTYTFLITDSNTGCTSTDEVVISENYDFPTAVIVTPSMLSCANDFITLDATGSSIGVGYVWYNDNGTAIGTGATQGITSPGTYILEVTNITSSCIASDTVEVQTTVIPPIADAGLGQTLNCDNTSVTLDGSGSSQGPNLSYEWLDASGVSVGQGVSISVSNAGNYILVVTDNVTGCTAIDNIFVLEDTDVPVVIITVNGILDCNNSTVTLDGSGSSTGPNLSYEWLDPTGTVISISTASSLDVTAPGDYTLVVTDNDNGCASSSSATVLLSNIATFSDAGQDQVLDCNGGTVTLEGTAVGGTPPYLEQWTDANGMVLGVLSATVDVAGIYTFTVMDGNGCVSTDEVEVFSFDNIADAGLYTTFSCSTLNYEIGTYTIDTSGFTFQWFDANGMFVNDGPIPMVSSLGTYTLFVTDPVTGCTDMDDLVFSSSIDIPIANVIVTGVLTCSEPSVLVESTGSTLGPGITYTWSDAFGNVIGTALTLSVTVPGTYILEIFDSATGCSVSTPFEVLADTNTPFISFTNPLGLNCNNDFTLTLTPFVGMGSFSYFWNGPNGFTSNEMNPVITGVNAVGTYTLTTTNLDNGCEVVNSMEITASQNSFEVNTTIADCDMSNGTASVISTLSNPIFGWSTGANTQMVSDLAQGWYSVTVSDMSLDCDLHQNFYIDEDVSCKVVIGGYVVNDINETCVFDVSMEPMECVMVKLNPLGIYTYTDTSGYYEFIVDDGDYTVEYIGSAFADLLCPLSGTYDVSLSMNGSVSDENHFYVLRKDYDLCISKNIGNARPGLKQFNCVQVCNYSAAAEDAVVTFRHDSLFAEVMPLPNIFPINALAGTYTYDAATFTFTWTVANLQPGECRKIMWHMEVPQTATVGDIISSTAKVGPIAGDINPTNNCMDWLLALTGSYDPNDKRNMVGETQWGGAIYEEDETMEYAIRFQNVGNDTAFTVVVRDTIDEAHLDVTTIRGITASHDVQVEFEGSNILIFRFEDILLVDSFTNEPASNGWLNFNIDRKSGQPFGTEIKNQAAIYFDFNAPIITNELVNALTNPVSIFSPKKENIKVQVLPNITNENVLLEFVLENQSDVVVQILNVEGLVMENIDFGKKGIGEYQEELSLKDFPSGVYFILIKTKNGNVVRKVVKM